MLVTGSHGLVTMFRQVDDAQPPVPETDWTIDMHTTVIGPAICNPVTHFLNQRPRNRFLIEIKSASDATHNYYCVKYFLIFGPSQMVKVNGRCFQSEVNSLPVESLPETFFTTLLLMGMVYQ